MIYTYLAKVGFLKRTRWLDLFDNALKVEEMGSKGLELEGRKVVAGKAKETKAAEVVAGAEGAVVDTTTAVAEDAEKEVGAESAAKGMGIQVAAAEERVLRKSVANEGTGKPVEVPPPVASMARAAKGTGKPAVAVKAVRRTVSAAAGTGTPAAAA